MEIQKNLYLLEVPLPNNPLKATNSFVFVSDERNLIIDSGFNQPECLKAMRAGLREIGLDLSRTDFLSTHLHSDHLGLFPELLADGATAYIGDKDADYFAQEGGWDQVVTNKRLNGFPAAEIDAVVRKHPGRTKSPRQAITWTRLAEGDAIAVGDYTLTCVETPGHTWGHICLFDSEKKMLIAGDHILGDITPNIQSWRANDDALGAYIKSLNKIAKLDIDLTLPGHRSFVTDTRGRIEELKQHHLSRCNEVMDILRVGEHHAYQTAARMSWEIRAKSWDDFPLMQKWFATGEAIAHLRFLEHRGLIQSRMTAGDIILFRLSDHTAVLETIE